MSSSERGSADEATTLIEVELNGEVTSFRVPSHWTLADVLREQLGLTGTHLGCEQGVCGACTLLLDDEPVRACIMLAAQADGHAVRTVEGLADGGSLHPIQQAFSDRHALQCGYCTPGFIMLAAAILEREPDATRGRIEQLLSANLCRCTGYQPIVQAVLQAQRGMAGS